MTERKSIKQRILEDLEKTGFPTELRAGQIFAEAGRELLYNVYYIDEDENKGREIDIIATCLAACDYAQLYLCQYFICSVKKSKKPWIIFSNDIGEYGDPGWHRLYLDDGINRDILSADELGEKSTISGFKRFGNAYNVAFHDSNKEIYDALCSSVKASESFRKLHQKWDAEEMNNMRETSTFKSLFLFEPLVILDGQLYEAYLDSNNKLAVKRIHHIPVCFGYVSLSYKHADEFSDYYVEIVTLDELANLVHKKDIWLDGIAKSISGNTEKQTK